MGFASGERVVATVPEGSSNPDTLEFFGDLITMLSAAAASGSPARFGYRTGGNASV